MAPEVYAGSPVTHLAGARVLDPGRLGDDDLRGRWDAVCSSGTCVSRPSPSAPDPGTPLPAMPGGRGGQGPVTFTVISPVIHASKTHGHGEAREHGAAGNGDETRPRAVARAPQEVVRGEQDEVSGGAMDGRQVNDAGQFGRTGGQQGGSGRAPGHFRCARGGGTPRPAAARPGQRCAACP